MEKELTSAIMWDFLDNLHQGIIVSTADGVIQHINQAARVLFQVDQTVSTMAAFYKTVAPTENWQALLEPNVKIRLQTDSGLVVDVESKHCQGDLLQIIFTPHTPAQNLTLADHLTALTQISNEPDLDKKLQLIANGLQAIGWERITLTLRDKDFHPTRIITAGFTNAEQKHLQENMLPAEAWQTLFADDRYQQLRQGACYFIPAESNWIQEHSDLLLPDQQATNKGVNSWHPLDILCTPLYDRRHRRIGLIGLDRPQNGRRPSQQDLRTIELYAQFAASTIENTQLVSKTLVRSEGLELLIKANQAISGSLEKETILTTLGNYMLQTADAEGYTIYQWQEENKTLVVLQDHPNTTTQEPLSSGKMFSVSDDSLVQKAIATEKLFIHHIREADDAFIYTPAWLEKSQGYSCIVLPIMLSGEVFGLIQLFKSHLYLILEPNENQVLMALANQAGAALETALIFEDAYERERFYTALGSVNLAINYTLELNKVLNLICSESVRIFDVDGAYIWARENDHFVGGAASGHSEEEFVGSILELTDTQAFVNTVVQGGHATYINHINQTDNIYLQLPQKETIQAALGVPLEQEGVIIGVLILIEKTEADRFSDKDVTQASLFGVQAAIALQNAKLFEELRQLNEELDSRVAERTHALNEESTRVKILLRITSELSSSLDQDRVLSRALHLVNEVVNATQGVILLIDQESGELVFRSSLGPQDRLPPTGVPSGLMRNEGLAGWMIDNRTSVIVHDTRHDPRWIERSTSPDHRSVLAVPLITNEEVIGTLMLFHSRPNAFTRQQLDLVEAAAIQVANAINNANLYLLIRDQAERLGTLLRLEQVEAAKSQAILESIADGVLVADAHSKITLINRAISVILDVPREELVGKSVNELLGLYGHSGDSWISTIEDWAQNADLIEQWAVLADRLTIEDKVVSVHLSPVFVGNSFFGTVSIFRDITKEVEVDKLKSEFVSTVSHELRTPMTSIKGYADLMLMGAAGTMSQSQSRYLQVIKSNADRLHMLVNDLLDISRIETGKTKLDLRPLDISQLVAQVIENHLHIRIQQEEKNLVIYSDISSALPLVNADQGGVIQILTNLLDNAFNYTAEGGEIRISAEARDNFVYISVKDSGIGISKENQAKIFDRFFRAEDETVQKVRGTGLGLAIVRSFIEMHGGTLEVDSTPDVGSIFTFNLPIVIEDGDEPT